VSEDHKQIREFQRFVWHRMPLRKYLCGHMVVFDIVAVLIQEWPADAVENSRSGDTQEVHALEDLVRSAKRHMALTYGQDYWEVWGDSLKPVIWQACWIVLQWYRADESNAGMLRQWRHKWRFHKKG
jgi:hypothetical protein